MSRTPSACACPRPRCLDDQRILGPQGHGCDVANRHARQITINRPECTEHRAPPHRRRRTEQLTLKHRIRNPTQDRRKVAPDRLSMHFLIVAAQQDAAAHHGRVAWRRAAAVPRSPGGRQSPPALFGAMASVPTSATSLIAAFALPSRGAARGSSSADVQRLDRWSGLAELGTRVASDQHPFLHEQGDPR